MPHISKKKLRRKTFLKIHDQLVRSIASVSDHKKTRSLLSELLTPTERVMIAKRLAVIVMFCRNYSGYKIHTTLKISPSTVTRLGNAFEAGAFAYLGSIFGKRKGGQGRKSADSDFWGTLEKIILVGMPRRTGKGRWKFLYEN